MSLWIWSFIAGLAATWTMDQSGRLFGPLNLSHGMDGQLGRWVLGFAKGRFVIDARETFPPQPGEGLVATLFHYLVGGGVVALGYPLALLVLDITPDNHFLPAFIYGLATLILAWFVQYPAFKFGVFGSAAPDGVNNIAAPVIMHTAYALGFAIVMAVARL
ncbi:MAG: DUF2938 family protein [Proteobacteria bacterium]|nr:DUF2938 family protein [Pseudomonadota bacterium]